MTGWAALPGRTWARSSRWGMDGESGHVTGILETAAPAGREAVRGNKAMPWP